MREEERASLYNLEVYGEVNEFLNKLSAARRESPYRNIPVPHILLGQDEGEGFSTFASQTTEILYKNHVIEFRSKMRLVECTFCQEINVNKLKEKIRYGTVITNVFYGVVAIDLKISLSRVEKDVLTEFIQFLKTNKDNICFLIRVNKDELEEARCFMEGVLNMNFYCVSIPRITCFQMADIAAEWMKKDGFGIDSEAIKVLQKTIEILQTQKQYCGLKTIRQLVERIELQHLMFSDTKKDQNISAYEISDFTDRILSTELVHSENSRRGRIGF